ncbi:MAG: YbbR-like domain-containing protein [Nitrospirae bacterium]|nr:YbbR-like domain-containing protein [Nitrospirota bacterium]
MKKENIFSKNFGLKIAAIFLSIVLWFYVTSRGQSEMYLDVPVEFKNIPPGLEMVNNTVKMISLNVKGQERFIRNLKPSDIRISIDLSKTKKGDNVYYITRDDIKTPHGITVSNINPSSLKITTEETLSKTVKVSPVIIGELEKDYSVRSVTIEPPTVVVEGSKSEVRKINKLKTEPLDITGITESFSQDLKLDLKGKNIRAKPDVIKIRVNVEK